MIYLEESPYPWRTWDKEVTAKYPSIFTMDYLEADILVLGYSVYLDFVKHNRCGGKNVFVLCEDDEHLINVKSPAKTLSENLKSDIRWIRPCRDVSKISQTGSNRSGRIFTAFDATSSGFSYRDLLVAYHTVEQLRNNDVQLDMFSVYPLKEEMQTYNQIQFWGLQRNKKMFEIMSQSDFMIFADTRPRFPRIAFEAMKIGLPVFFKRADNWWLTGNYTYDTEEELISFIKDFYDSLTFNIPDQQTIPHCANQEVQIEELVSKVTK